MPNDFAALIAFRAFSALRLIRVLPQGVALGYYISRPWRSGLKFSHRHGSDWVRPFSSGVE
jgi:hypothetical protein